MYELKYKIENNRLVKKSDGKPIPDDEPVFIFRGQDRKALAAMVAYCTILDDLDHRASVKRAIDAFREFMEKHPDRMKEPDV